MRKRCVIGPLLTLAVADLPCAAYLRAQLPCQRGLAPPCRRYKDAHRGVERCVRVLPSSIMPRRRQVISYPLSQFRPYTACFAHRPTDFFQGEMAGLRAASADPSAGEGSDNEEGEEDEEEEEEEEDDDNNDDDDKEEEEEEEEEE